MMTVFRQTLLCLLLLWLPVSWAAEPGWLRSPDNDHASVRLRADTSAGGETRLLLDVKLEDGWKTYWRSPGEGALRLYRLERGNACGRLVLANPSSF
jgi:suppressor for copper-sensitivity B